MSDHNGLVVVNKPRGPTSHDVVAQARRVFGTRAIGHAGTLDPMASGVLLLLIGEATKLSSALTLERKSYRAVVEFGVGTDSDDAAGKPIVFGDVTPNWLEPSRLEVALEGERQRNQQVPPQVSAIKQGGIAAYRRHRRGESVDLAPRQVQVHELRVIAASDRQVELHLSVSKGYYVRALARDLGATLCMPAHLSALCRTSSGCFSLDEAVGWPPGEIPRPIPLGEAVARAMPIRVLSADGARRAGLGQLLLPEHFEPCAQPPPAGTLVAWLDAQGVLIALGRSESDGTARVVRGFRNST
jgi:tRNA pseudouridine55 synthase